MRFARFRWGVVLIVVGLIAGGCAFGPGAGGSTVLVTVGYQSKTIDTVNAGTLLRDRGTFEADLDAIGSRSGVHYQVVWQDFPSGSPLTAQMLADKVDIGSMGDYPVLVNGSKTGQYTDSKTQLVAITGYNLRGSLNQVVVPSDSPARTLADLRGKVVSTSLGSAAHGMLEKALQRNGMAASAVHLLNQDPSVGASALEAGQVAALAQFVPWPQLMVFRGQGRLLYDGGSNGIPTFHAVVARQSFTAAHPEVLQAYLDAMRQTTDYINQHPLAAAERVAAITGLPAEVVYLYNGPNGLVTFDPTIKQPLVAAMATDLPFLRDLGSVTSLDIGRFVNDSYVRKAYGPTYDATEARLTDPDTLIGTDQLCHLPVSDRRTASEVWFAGQDTTQVAATPTCLLKRIKADRGAVRAAYVPDSLTGTRLFANAATWVLDPSAPATARLLPFALAADADTYLQAHPADHRLDYQAALSAA